MPTGAVALLYIDLSGGMRDTATLLLIVARYLKDIRMVQTKKVLYSELKGNSSVVRDSTGLYNLMDLITAVDAFFSTGTTEKLKAYMKQTGETDPDILNLLDRIDHFADDLALCRVQMLKADLKAIARQIKQRPASRETLSSLLYELMNDRFEAEFQNLMGSRSDSLPALVQWCAHHRMYQQGLTLLSEEMPTYLCGHLFLQPTGKALDYMALQPQNKGKSWVFQMFHYHFCRAALFHEARPFTVNLCLTKDKTEANGNALFRVATLTEAQEYLTAAVEQGELLLDLTRKDTVAQGIVYYQSVQQYRNQINHATDSAVKFQKDTGLLPLSTSAIEQTLGDVAFYLFKLKEWLSFSATCSSTAEIARVWSASSMLSGTETATSCSGCTPSCFRNSSLKYSSVGTLLPEPSAAGTVGFVRTVSLHRATILSGRDAGSFHRALTAASLVCVRRKRFLLPSGAGCAK